MPTDNPVNEARTIERLPIDSTSIRAIGYDDQRQVLSVEFNGGSIFHYYNVPITVFEDMGASESRGRFYSQHIRGKYTSKSMTGLCPKCQAKGLIGERCEYCSEGTIREIDHTHKD